MSDTLTIEQVAYTLVVEDGEPNGVTIEASPTASITIEATGPQGPRGFVGDVGPQGIQGVPGIVVFPPSLDGGFF